MSWYSTQKRAFVKKESDVPNWAKGLGIGSAIGSIPVAIIILTKIYNITPSEAIQHIAGDEQKAEDIIQQAPKEITEQAAQEASQQSAQQSNNKSQEQNQSPSSSGNPFAAFIAQWEGQPQHTAFPDGDSKSIGRGFYLGNASAKHRIENLGLDFEKVYNGKQSLTEEQINTLFMEDIQLYQQIAEDLFPNFNNHPVIVQKILVDLAYNLGRPNLSKFQGFIEAVQNKNYKKAAQELVNSKWYQQVGNRAKHHVNVLSNLGR